MRIISLVSALLVSTSTLADWQLDPAQSTLNFLSTKKAQVTEIHQIKTLSGKLDDAGNAVVELDLSSVDTGIDIRNQRMIKFLFAADKFPMATVKANVSAELLALAAGETQVTSLDADLDLHGMKQSLKLPVTVTGLADGGIQVTSIKPVLISSADFGLTEGVEKLKSLAGLDSITLTVPVTFNLRFKQ
ncbi:YceI family protein [Neptunicella sp.]|uniref:YceI family protein n=1 Tax=Neptunicella sp. TaxID=2125986 RepID=UPI003F68C4ED